MKLKILFLLFFIFFLNNNLFCFQEKSNNSTYDSLSKKASELGRLKENKKAVLLVKKLLHLAKLNNNNTQIATSHYRLGLYYGRSNLKDSSYYSYNNAIKFYLLEKDSIGLAKALLNKAILESDFGDYTNSDISGIKGLKYLNGTSKLLMTSIYNCLAINSKKQKLFTEAIYNYKKALFYNTSHRFEISIKNNISIVYKELKDYSKSILMLENLLKDSITNQKTKAKVIDNLAYSKWLYNSKDTVLKDFLLAEFIRNKEKDSYGLIASYSHLSEFYFQKNKVKALFYANKMYKMSKTEKNPQDQIDAIDIITTLQTPQKSIKYYKESIRLRDSLKEVETQKKYKFAKIKYNYEEEEKEKLKFKTLAIENKLVAEQEESQKKNILISGVFLTSGLLFLIYRRKEQHKKRILQESYNTEIRIAKKLHDELGNDIYNTLTKVQNPEINSEEIINDLDKIYLQTRAISHENDSIETGANFEKYFRNLVASYNSDSCKIILKDLSCLDLNNLKKGKQIVMYRVFNELFVNMKKHSKASLVVLACKKTNHNVEISYADNGVGFKEDVIIFKNGLKNMETRIKTINGIINFENKPNKGLKVNIHFKN